MKQLLLTGLFIMASIANYAQGYEVATDDHYEKKEKMLLGSITDSLMVNDTAFKWFPEAEKVYTPQPAVVKVVKDNKDKINFKVVMGTWCPDSHYVIPRFFKILETAGVDKTKVNMLAVDRSKKDKNKITEVLNIVNVPTIIVYNNNKELGRVVEYGETGRFDSELAEIIKKAK